MAEHKTSKESKNKILRACKELFYLNGYKNTTYVDICRKANSNPGLINYYFKTKKNISATIYGDFFMQIKEAVKTYMLEKYGYYDLQYGTTIEILLFGEICNRDEKFGRFYYDICLEGVEYDSESNFFFYKLHNEEYNLGFSDDELRLIYTSVIGSGIGITKYLMEDLINLDPKVVFEFRMRDMFSMMKVSNERINEILRESQKIFCEMKYEVKDFFIFNLE